MPGSQTTRLRVPLALLAVLVAGALGASSAQAVTGPTLTGQVTTTATGNAGVAGVEVDIFSGATEVGSATTDSNGDYVFSAFPGVGNYDVEFDGSSQGYSTQWYQGASSESTATPVTVSSSSVTPPTASGSLQPDQVSGTVADLGNAIDGIEVELVNSSHQEIAQTTTNSQGDFSFSPVPPASGDVVEFNPGQANSEYNTTSSNAFQVVAGQTVTEKGELIKEGEIDGTVTDSSDQGIAGVDVTVTDLQGDSVGNATTGANGSYAVDGLPTGKYNVEFSPPSGENYIYQWYPGKAEQSEASAISVTSPNATLLNATLVTGAMISGTVSAASGSTPLGGVQVTLLDYGNDEVASTTTSASGSYSMNGIPAGTYVLDFDPDNGTNYVEQFYNDVGPNGVPTPLTVTAGSSRVINAALATGAEISGRVTDAATGQPVSGVFVQLWDAAGQVYDTLGQFDQGGVNGATTGADGTYTLMGVSPSASYRVYFSPPSGSQLANAFYVRGATPQTATPVAVTVGHTTANINEALPVGGSIAGTVTYAPNGSPLNDVGVELCDTNDNPLPDGTTRTYQDGYYSFTNLLPGKYKVEFNPLGSLSFQFFRGVNTAAEADAITVAGGLTTGSINAALGQGGNMSGKVTSAATGSALPDATVALLDGDGHVLDTASTDANGLYLMSGIPAGTYYVRFAASGRGNVGRANFATRTSTMITIGGGSGATSGTQYEAQYYKGKQTLTGATPVTIKTGATTANINAALAVSSATGPPPKPGPPTIAAGAIAGLASDKPRVTFRLAAGANGAPKLRSFTVGLPTGLSFVSAKLKAGVLVTGGGKVSESLSGGRLVVTLGVAATHVSVSLSAPALKASSALVAKAKRHQIASLTVTVAVKPVSGQPSTLRFSVKDPA
jgi:Carboxypeptidase regulatory-like domain